MYFLYLDDSGSPKNTTEDYFVLGGIVLHEDNLRWLMRKLDLLAERIYPSNPTELEFHAAECYRGVEQPWKVMSKPDRIKIIKDVLLSIEDGRNTIQVFGCAVHKESFPHEDPVEKAFEDISSRFSYFIEHHPVKDQEQKGLIIIDKSSYELGLQSLVKGFRASGNRWGRQLRNICDVPMFIDSKASRIIQFADHVAYSIFRRYNSGDLNYFNCIEDRFEVYDGKMQSLSHLHHLKKACTCPVCISRK